MSPWTTGLKSHVSDAHTMIIGTVLGLLALFSFVSILVSDGDELPQGDPRDRLPTWARFRLR